MPEGWANKKLGQIVILNYGKALKADDRESGSIPVYGSAGIVGSHNKCLVDGQGVIVGRKGNVGSVYWLSKSFYPIDTVYYVISDLPLYFIFYLLKHIQFINNDAAVPGLNRNAAYASKVKIPSEYLINLFSRKVDVLFKTVDILKQQNQHPSTGPHTPLGRWPGEFLYLKNPPKRRVCGKLRLKGGWSSCLTAS